MERNERMYREYESLLLIRGGGLGLSPWFVLARQEDRKRLINLLLLH
jgi:hypothetical protein